MHTSTHRIVTSRLPEEKKTSLQRDKPAGFMEVELSNKISHFIEPLIQQLDKEMKSQSEAIFPYEKQKSLELEINGLSLQADIVSSAIQISPEQLDYKSMIRDYYIRLNVLISQFTEIATSEWIKNKSKEKKSFDECETRCLKTKIKNAFKLSIGELHLFLISPSENLRNQLIRIEELKQKKELQLKKLKAKRNELEQEREKEKSTELYDVSLEDDKRDLLNKLTILRKQCQQRNMSAIPQLRWFFLDEARQLQENKKDIDELDMHGLNLMHYACMLGDLVLIRELHALGANTRVKTRNGYSSFHLIVNERTNDLVEVLDFLKPNKVEINTKLSRTWYTLTHLVALQGNIDAMKWLLDNEADVNPDKTIEFSPVPSPLHCAAFRGHVEIVNLLLKAGANPHKLNKFKETPLVDAIMHKQRKVAELFYANGIWLTQAQTDYLLRKSAEYPDKKDDILACLEVPSISTSLSLATLTVHSRLERKR